MLKSLKISAKLAGISALLLAVGAVDAEASFALNIATSADQLVAPGASGQSYFDLTFSGSGQSTFVRNDLWAVDENGNQLTQGVDSPFTSLTIDSSSSLHTTSGTKYSAGTYRVVVDWALASDAPQDTSFGVWFNLVVTKPSSKLPAQAGASDAVNVNSPSGPVGVPEPNQALAASMLLGCGILSVTTRRWLKKAND